MHRLKINTTTCAAKTILQVAFLVLLGSFAASGPAIGQAIKITVNTPKAISEQLYGVNGQNRNSDPWDQISQPNFAAALGSLKLKVLRFPAGTGANYWDWQTGDFSGYSAGSQSPYVSKLSELQAELASTQTASADFVLNLLTNPNYCTIADEQQGNCLPPCPPSGQQSQCSPNVAYQMQIFSAYGSTIPYVELGNEYWGSNVCNVAVYQDQAGANPDMAGQTYAENISGYINNTHYNSEDWISQVKATDSGVKIAAIGNYVTNGAGPSQIGPTTGNARSVFWNNAFFQASPALPDVDALVIHVYSNPGIENLIPQSLWGTPFNGNGVNSSVTEAMLAMPFHTQDDIATNYLDDSCYNGENSGSCAANAYTYNNVTYYNIDQLQTSGAAYEPDIWVTEFNLRDFKVAAFGTWAHGLFAGTMALKFLENTRTSNHAARVTMADQHDTYGGPTFAEIFDSNMGFKPSSGPPPPPIQPICTSGGGGGGNSITFPAVPLPTYKNQLTATGLTQQLINTASAGQSSAAKLQFPGGPMITDPAEQTYQYPALYGWKFSGSGNTQLVILNLGSSPQSIDVSGIYTSGPAYTWKIYGDPGAYVQGYDGTNYVASYEDSAGVHSDNLTVMSGQQISNLKSVTIQPYSITRIAQSK